MKHIIRSGYTVRRSRKTITVRRKDGKTYKYVRKASTSRVKPVPIPDVGAAGKGPKVIGPLKKGMLTQYGYHPVEAMSNRHKSLAQAISKGEKPLAVFRRLQAISILTKRTVPRASRIYKQDAGWVRRSYAKSFKTAIKKM
jgi:Family of unknown function (DUF5771)